jgi:hypothetical protein
MCNSGNTTYKYGDPAPKMQKLYNHIRQVQLGELPDRHGWTRVVA